MMRYINYRFLIAIALALVMALTSTAVFAQEIVVRNASPLGSRGIGKSETALGNLVADAIREAMDTDIAFVAASEVKERDPFPVGRLTASEVADAISYPDDPLAVLTLTGAQIKEALERAVTFYPQPNLGFLQVSGMVFTFDPSKSAENRVTSVVVDGSVLRDDRTYTVAVTNSMANGALGYWKVWSKDDVTKRRPDISTVGAVERFLKARQTIDYKAEGRITAK